MRNNGVNGICADAGTSNNSIDRNGNRGHGQFLD